jgi:hypothetical protein
MSKENKSAEASAKASAQTKIANLVRRRQARKEMSAKLEIKDSKPAAIKAEVNDRAKATVKKWDKEESERGWSAGRVTAGVAKAAAVGIEKVVKTSSKKKGSHGYKQELKAAKRESGWEIISNKWVQAGMNFLMDLPLDIYNKGRAMIENAQNREEKSPLREFCAKIGTVMKIGVEENIAAEKAISEVLMKSIDPKYQEKGSSKDSFAPKESFSVGTNVQQLTQVVGKIFVQKLQDPEVSVDDQARSFGDLKGSLSMLAKQHTEAEMEQICGKAVEELKGDNPPKNVKEFCDNLAKTSAKVMESRTSLAVINQHSLDGLDGVEVGNAGAQRSPTFTSDEMQKSKMQKGDMQK